MSIGENIRKLRKSQGLTQKELANKLGKTPQYISKLEKDINHPTTETIRKIARALEIGYFDLLLADMEKKIYESLSFYQKENIPIFVTGEVYHMLLDYCKLNELGQKKAAERIHELTLIEQYLDKSDPLPEAESETDEQ